MASFWTHLCQGIMLSCELKMLLHANVQISITLKFVDMPSQKYQRFWRFVEHALFSVCFLHKSLLLYYVFILSDDEQYMLLWQLQTVFAWR